MKILTEKQVRARFDAAVKEAGGVRAFARRVGVSSTFISFINTGKSPIAGRVAQALGLEPVKGWRVAKC